MELRDMADIIVIKGYEVLVGLGNNRSIIFYHIS